MNFTDRYKILTNIIAQQGIEVDLYQELARAESEIHRMDQQMMTPPPVPDDIEADNIQPTVGRYDDI